MDKINLGLAHVGLFVRDLEVSKKFYCEKLDFSVIHENTLDDKEGVIRIAFIQAHDCVIELIQLPQYTKRSDGLFDHLAFKVKNIEEVVEKLKSKGIDFETQDILFAPHFFSRGDKWIIFRGPDQERLEFSEILYKYS